MNGSHFWGDVFRTIVFCFMVVIIPPFYRWLLRTCDRIDESIARRRGEWDPILGKRIPYWDRKPGARGK
jgi:hypothetical protein